MLAPVGVAVLRKQKHQELRALLKNASLASRQGMAQDFESLKFYGLLTPYFESISTGDCRYFTLFHSVTSQQCQGIWLRRHHLHDVFAQRHHDGDCSCRCRLNGW